MSAVQDKAQEGDSNKRKADSSLATCVRCDESFDPDVSDAKDCSYHGGELEFNDAAEVWADHDHDAHGDPDTLENRKEFPQGYTWSCCDKDGTAKGCTSGQHQADSAKSQKDTHEPVKATEPKGDDGDEDEGDGDDEEEEEEEEEEEDDDEEGDDEAYEDEDEDEYNEPDDDYE